MEVKPLPFPKGSVEGLLAQPGGSCYKFLVLLHQYLGKQHLWRHFWMKSASRF